MPKPFTVSALIMWLFNYAEQDGYLKTLIDFEEKGEAKGGLVFLQSFSSLKKGTRTLTPFKRGLSRYSQIHEHASVIFLLAKYKIRHFC